MWLMTRAKLHKHEPTFAQYIISCDKYDLINFKLYQAWFSRHDGHNMILQPMAQLDT